MRDEGTVVKNAGGRTRATLAAIPDALPKKQGKTEGAETEPCSYGWKEKCSAEDYRNCSI